VEASQNIKQVRSSVYDHAIANKYSETICVCVTVQCEEVPTVLPKSHAYLSLSLSSHPFTARRWNPPLGDYWHPDRPLKMDITWSVGQIFLFQNLLSCQTIIKTTEPNFICHEQRKNRWLQYVSPSNVAERSTNYFHPSCFLTTGIFWHQFGTDFLHVQTSLLDLTIFYSYTIFLLTSNVSHHLNHIFYIWISIYCWMSSIPP
jgi:hypothetical protein